MKTLQQTEGLIAFLNRQPAIRYRLVIAKERADHAVAARKLDEDLVRETDHEPLRDVIAGALWQVCMYLVPPIILFGLALLALLSERERALALGKTVPSVPVLLKENPWATVTIIVVIGTIVLAVGAIGLRQLPLRVPTKAEAQSPIPHASHALPQLRELAIRASRRLRLGSV